MIIRMNKEDKKLIEDVVKRVREQKVFDVQMNYGQKETVIAVLGSNTADLDTGIFEVMPGVKEVIRIMSPYKLASRDFRNGERTKVRVGNFEVGGDKIIVMAGPCAVESRGQITACAHKAKQLGCSVLRGGAFKPRTSPFKFQGLELEGLKMLAEARKETGLPVVSEVIAVEHVPMMCKYVDILQIGARNMQNYPLLSEAAKTGMPILLKRGPSASIEEWLMAADYLLRGNDSNVILCERGIKTLSNSMRYTLEIGSIPVVKGKSHLPVIVDPSHAAGNYRYVAPLARAAIAAGADGILVEIHPEPQKALCDGPQSLTFSDFGRLMSELGTISKAIGKKI